MSPKDWKQVEHALWTPYGSVALSIDSYDVQLQVRQVGVLRFEIVPFVNGVCKGVWVLHECEERRRFLRPVQKPLWTPTKKRELTKGIPRKMIKQYFPNLDEKMTFYHLGWPTFGPLKRHLIKNNTSIELKVEA